MKKAAAGVRDQNHDLCGQPLTRTSLHEIVVERLREMVMTGQLPPGSRVPEKQLCEVLGVSRTPLREALKVLASDGL
ncbi:MAG TPA: GntR family transcriptional regulator, partial [Gammaproteobacteria bacterium]|nr:GntR family transcriptional regulator [Gammaproteobacteria bacterium]